MTAGPRSDSAATLYSSKSALWSAEPDDDVQDTSADERKTGITYRHVRDRTDAPRARTVSPRSLPVVDEWHTETLMLLKRIKGIQDVIYMKIAGLEASVHGLEMRLEPVCEGCRNGGRE